MTAADLATTVRSYVSHPDGVINPDVASALDALVAQAETAEGFKDQYFAVCQRAEAAEAERDHAHDALRNAARTIDSIVRAALGNKP